MSTTSTGPLALLGSGEYLDVMNELDLRLLDAVGGVSSARVALIPAACGQEPGSPERWNDLGVAHFRDLGAMVTPLPLISRTEASDPAVLEELRRADLIYFSGGSPPYLIDTMEGTPAWDVIRERHSQGAALAGCSAGAILFGDRTFNHRGVMAGEPLVWRRAIGLLPGVAVIAHFDRFTRRWGAESLRSLLQSAPGAITVVGIDEDTAIMQSPDATNWQVMGRGGVTVFPPGSAHESFRPGDRLPLTALTGG